MAGKEVKLGLKVDSTSGQASIKKTSDQLKAMETSAITGAAAMKGGMLATAGGVALVGAATTKALSSMDKLKKSAKDFSWVTPADLKAADDLVDKMRKTNKFTEEQLKNIKKQTTYFKQRAAASKTLFNSEKKVTTELKKQEKTTKGLKQHLFTLRSYWLAITAAAAVATITVVKFFSAGFSAVEKFRLSVASAAASITTFSDLSAGNVDEVYANAYKYAGKLALKMEIINARTIASGDQLRAMNETFIQQGVLLDINSKKQEDAFVSVANAIALITQGQNQEIQMRQEIRGLLSGDIRATNLLARMIDVKLGGSLKENIKQWKQQGTLLENLGKHLEGFKAGSADLASTWAALSTTFDTIVNRYLRRVFKPIYEDIIRMSLDFSRSLLEQEENTEDVTTETGSLYKTWLLIKTTLSTSKKLMEEMSGPMKFVMEYSEAVLDSMLGMAIAAEMFAEKSKKSVKDVETLNKSLEKRAESIQKGLFGDKEGSKKALEESLSLFEDFGKSAGEKSATSFLDEWRVRVHEALGTLQLPGKEEEGEDPELVPPPEEDEEELQKRGRLLDLMSKMEEENARNKIRLNYEGYEQRKQLLQLELDANVEMYGSHEAFYKNYQSKLDLLNKEQIEKQLNYAIEVSEKEKEILKQREKLKVETLESFRTATMTESQLAIDSLNMQFLKYDTFVKDKAALDAWYIQQYAAIEEAESAKKAADHETVLQYISTERENDIRAINTERDAMLERTTTLEEYIAVLERSAQLKTELAGKTETQTTGMQKWASTAISSTEQWENTAIHAAESFSSGITDAFFEFAEGTKSAGEAFKQFAASFLKQIAKMIMQQLILNALKTATGAFFGDGGVVEGGVQTAANGMAVSNGNKMMEYAKGAAFNNGRMQAFATGGIVNSPTIFPMKNGAGLMGEAGPEAIMPLKRGKDGKLGVEGGGGNTVNTTINVTTGGEGEDPEASKRRGREMAKVIESEFNKNLTKQLRPGGILNQN